ncbi:MAG: DUF547 domain-containing protein [Gemmatimonadales bacterium]|nr:MAG: DUF547 domain-containing protein [Gemmatimonadales bacterium]
MGGETAALEGELSTLSDQEMAPVLDQRDAGLAFWVNVYNAATQLRLQREPELFTDRRRFFGTPCVKVAGKRLSLDEVEHGILRGGKPKLGLGFIPGIFSRAPFPGVDLPLDSRIHFALNCGAASCPPIAAYTAGGIETELALATRSYLEQEVRYDPDRNVAILPRICLWYLGDFGGLRGLRALLQESEIVPTDGSPTLRFSSYDWRPTPGRFTGPSRSGRGSA